MNEKLNEINRQIEILALLIKDYQESLLLERVVINKDEFKKMDHLGKVANNPSTEILNYNNGMIFKLPNDNSNSYRNNHYLKLMSGELDRLILNKKSKPYYSGDYLINYELESEERTILKDQYPDIESI